MGANSARFYNILSACIATGEHEKVTNGKKKHVMEGIVAVHVHNMFMADLKVCLKITCL